MCQQMVEGKENQVKALGKFLVDKTASYPDFVEEIVAADQNISYEWLLIVRRVGYGVAYPPIVAHYRTPGVRRISKFKYGRQIALWKEGVVVVQKSSNGFVEKRKSICNLSFKEVCRVFAKGDELRSVSEQIEHLQTLKIVVGKKFSIRNNCVHVTRKCVLNRKELIEIVSAVLPQSELIGLLSKTQGKKQAA